MKFKLQELKLNTIFYIIIVFSVILPVSISATLLITNYTREIQIAEESHKRMEQHVSLNLHLLLSAIKAELTALSQNPDVIELLNTKQEFRRYVENRVFGRLQEMSLKMNLPLRWKLYNHPLTEVILASNSSEGLTLFHNSTSEGFSLSPDSKDIVVRKDINLDDQNLSGPNSNRKGSLTLNISIDGISKIVSGLIKIVTLDHAASIPSLKVEVKKPETNYTLLFVSIFILSFILLFSTFSGLYLMKTYILKPIEAISHQLQKERMSHREVTSNHNELYLLKQAIVAYVEYLQNSEKEKAEKARVEAISHLTRQVAHDIRSPLSALNLVSSVLVEVDEEKRLLIRNAVQRINDIANQLLEKGKETVGNKSPPVSNSIIQAQNSEIKTELLSPLIDSIVSEKRIQFREKQNIVIEADINQGYGLFAKVNSVELQRMISNLLNNSIEALPDFKGQVKVAIRGYRNLVNIIIQDNGKGIPEASLKKLGERGFSHGKNQNESQSGSGLGIYHAKQTTESFEGKFEVLSKEGLGTTITIHLPRVEAPSWFVQKIIVKSHMKIISVDDDLAIHQIWKGRFQSAIHQSIQSIDHITFTSGEEFKRWVLTHAQAVQTAHSPQDSLESPPLFLVDYELLGQNKTGLDLIEELHIAKNAILVTSRYEETKVRERCEKLKLQIIPKTMAGFVPIEVISAKN